MCIGTNVSNSFHHNSFTRTINSNSVVCAAFLPKPPLARARQRVLFTCLRVKELWPLLVIRATSGVLSSEMTAWMKSQMSYVVISHAYHMDITKCLLQDQ